jgi:hypothetical protein
MDDIHRLNRHGRRSLDAAHDRDRAAQVAGTVPSAYLEAHSRTLPSNLNTEIQQLPRSFRNSAQDSPPSAPPNLFNSTSASARSAHFLALGAESQRDLQHLPSYPSYFPAASSPVASGMLTLEQQLALLNEERQRSRALPTASSSLSDRVLSVEQQLSAYTEERHRRSASTAATSCLPGSAVNIDPQQQLAFLLEQQQQGRHQKFQAPTSAPDRIPTIDQLRASLNDGRGSLQATSSLQNSASTIDEHQGRSGDSQGRRMSTIKQQLASLNDEHQRRYGSLQAARSVPQTTPTIEARLASLIGEQQGRSIYFQNMRMPTMEQQLASLIGATSNSPTSHFPSNPMVEQQPSQLLSVVDQQFLAQLQRNAAPPQAQLESQVWSYPLVHAAQGHSEPAAPPPLPSAVPTEDPIVIPPAYGRNGQIEAFPEKLYRLLAEAEKDENDRIISFTPDGRAFKIHNREAFIKEVSPKYFRHAKITSFVRQLNFYGFQKLLDGPNRGAFMNPPFLRGHPELLVMVKRKEIAPRPKRNLGHGD